MNKNKFKRIIIWGLKKKYHTHRHIHKAFYENAKKLGYEALWLEDDKKNTELIQADDLIISAEVVGKMVPEKFKIEDYNLPIRDDVYYCLHNFKEVFKAKLNPKNYINLIVYQNEAETSDQKLNTATFFNTKTRSLYQPWGTDLLYEEFKEPIYSNSKFVFWIGSIWNNISNQGNLQSILELKQILKKYKLIFLKLRFIPDWLNIFFIRHSKIAPAIAGEYQVKINYLPCRMFKNISYGQLGITNVRKFKDILGDSFIEGETIKDLVINALSLSKDEYIAKVKAQQEAIKNFTYKNALENIIASCNYEK